MRTNGGKLSIMAGLLLMGLSPSFLDWQQSPEQRWQIYAFYGTALGLIALGLWDGE